MKFTKQNSVIVNASMKITHRRVPRDLRMYLFCLSQLVSYLHLTISIVDILALCFKQGPYVSNKGSSTPLFVSYGIYIWSVKKPREFGTLIRKQLKKRCLFDNTTQKYGLHRAWDNIVGHRTSRHLILQYINCDLDTHFSGGVLFNASVFVAALYYFAPVDRHWRLFKVILASLLAVNSSLGDESVNKLSA